MRFLRIDLQAFGPFADAPPLELGEGNRGLHLIVGGNEAGKSTTLRAIRHLLFGFPSRSPDDQLHKYDKFRLGATLRDEAGLELAFVRRKKEVNPLWTSDDQSPIDPLALSPFLDGLDEERFNDLFAMDHAELVQGGRAILTGKGNLGSILFAAGSGLAGIDEVRRSIDGELETLFKPKGQNPTINLALAEIESARKLANAAMLATTDWVELDAELARLRGLRESGEAEIRRLEGDKRRLERLRDALPVILRLSEKKSKLAEIGDAPSLAEGFADRRRDAMTLHQVGERAATKARSALDEVAQALAALGPRDPVLDDADAIRLALGDLGLYRQAVEGRPVTQTRLDRRRNDARILLDELRPGVTLENAETVRVSPAQKDLILALARERDKLDLAIATAEAEVSRAHQAHPEATSQPLGPGAARIARDLAETLKQAQARGDLESQVAGAKADLARLERQAAVDLAALPLWGGTLGALETLAIPSNPTIDRFESQMTTAAGGVDAAHAELDRLEAERVALVRKIDRDQKAHAVPSVDDLATHRDHRDNLWRAVRRAWIDREPLEAPEPVADNFETATRRADSLSDRLRLEASAVATQAQRLVTLRELLERITLQSASLDRSKLEREAVDQAWLDLWAPLGLAPLPPREMKDWATIRRADLVRQAKGLRDAQVDLERRAAEIEATQLEVDLHLTRLGEPARGPGESSRALLARASAAVGRVEATLQWDASKASLARLIVHLGDWTERWESALDALGLAAEIAPDLVLKRLARFDDLAAILADLTDLQQRSDDQARTESRFQTTIGTLANRLDASDSDLDPEETAALLDDRLKAAQVQETLRAEYLKRQRKVGADLEKTQLDVDRADADLRGLMSEAGCPSIDDLIAAERASDEIKSLKKELHALEDHLASLAGPIPVARLVEEASEADPEILESRIADLVARLEPLERDRDRLGEEIGRGLQKIEAMDGGPAAADAQQRFEEKVSGLAVVVERYARLRLASAVLREAVERYRKEHQGPILERAGALFAQLTARSFGGLRAELDDKGQPLLVGLRPDGTTAVKVEGMSEGTADQLYLALRLASLQTYMDAHEPMPLIVDDILVNFDNTRSLAALQTLADLSNQTQILFFTHHEHLVDLARSTLPEGVLFVHRLESPADRLIKKSLAGPPVEPAKPRRPKKVATDG